MANKVINIGNTQKTEIKTIDSDIVFKDISMLAKYVSTTKSKYKPSKEFIAILKEEGVDTILIDDVYTLFMMQYADDPNPIHTRINEILKRISIYKIDQLINIYAILNSLHNIFTWRPGERILNPEFGSRLYTLLYEGITPENEERIAAEIRHCVSVWEPRVSISEIQDISTIDDTENNTIHLAVVFTIPGISDEQYTYSFKFNKSSIL